MLTANWLLALTTALIPSGVEAESSAVLEIFLLLVLSGKEGIFMTGWMALLFTRLLLQPVMINNKPLRARLRAICLFVIILIGLWLFIMFYAFDINDVLII